MHMVGDSASESTKDSFREKLRNGDLNDREIEIEVQEQAKGMPQFDVPGMPGASIGMMNLGDMLGMGAQTKKKKMTVEDSYEILIAEESDKLLD